MSMHVLCSLEESGQTALGPAVIISVMIASKVPGSKVMQSPSIKHLNNYTLLTGIGVYRWSG